MNFFMTFTFTIPLKYFDNERLVTNFGAPCRWGTGTTNFKASKYSEYHYCTFFSACPLGLAGLPELIRRRRRRRPLPSDHIIPILIG
jgi:hypothetical protein